MIVCRGLLSGVRWLSRGDNLYRLVVWRGIGGCQEVVVCRGLLSGVRWLSRGDSL